MCGTPNKLAKTTRSSPTQEFFWPITMRLYRAPQVPESYSADEEEAALREQPMAPFKSPNGLLMLFRADLRRFDDLWDMTIDQNEGDVMLAHDQWYFFLARALGEVRFIDEPLVVYRQHAGNTLGVTPKPSLRQRFARRLVHFGTADEWAARSAEFAGPRSQDHAREGDGVAARSTSPILTSLSPKTPSPCRHLLQKERGEQVYRAGPLPARRRLSGWHMGFQTGVHCARSLEWSGSRQVHGPHTNFVMRLGHSRTRSFSRLN